MQLKSYYKPGALWEGVGGEGERGEREERLFVILSLLLTSFFYPSGSYYLEK